MCGFEGLRLLPSRLKIVPYLYDMASAYAAADLLVARAGAMTCSELAVTGNASILVPLPSATDDHQTANARSMEERGKLPGTKADSLLLGPHATPGVLTLQACLPRVSRRSGPDARNGIDRHCTGGLSHGADVGSSGLKADAELRPSLGAAQGGP